MRPVYMTAAKPVYITGFDTSGATPIVFNAIDSWRIETFGDTNPLIVPANTEYQLLSIWVEFTTTATPGDRQLVVEIQDPYDNVILQPARAGIVQADGETNYYLFTTSISDLGAFRDTNYLTVPIPLIYLEPYKIVTVYDNNDVDVSDEITVTYVVNSRATNKLPTILPPGGVEGILAWYDFSNKENVFSNTTLTKVAEPGEQILSIKDISGNGYNGIRASGNGPTLIESVQNGKSAGLFTLEDLTGLRIDSLGPALSGDDIPFTIFSVVYHTNVPSVGMTASWALGSSGSGIYPILGELVLNAQSHKIGIKGDDDSSPGTVSGGDTTPDSELSIFVLGYPHVVVDRLRAWKDGTTSSVTQPGWGVCTFDVGLIGGWFTDGLEIGYFSGYVGELLFYDRLLADSEINIVANYLSNKWNTGWTAI